MTPRTMILIFAAVLTAGGTIYFAQSWISRERAQLEAMKKQPVKEEGTQILVAKKNLPAGLFVKPEDVEWRAWPKEGVAPTYYLKGKAEKTALIGAVVRRGIAAGEPMTDGKLAKPGDQGFLAAVLEPGMRAITVSINQTSGIAGFVFPGDRVDLLLTAEVADADGSGQKRFATETVLTKIRVLAMDQRVNDVDNTPKVSKTITVEVTPKQAEMIAVAGQLGRLSLSLRSLANDDARKDAAETTTASATTGTTTTPAGASTTTTPAENETTIAADDAAAKAKSDKRKKDDAVAADKTETQPPERGKSVTFDSEASRLIGPRADHNKVTIIRGAKSTTVRTGAGNGSSGAKSVEGPAGPNASDDSAADEGAAGGSNATDAQGGAAAPQKTESNKDGGAGAVGTSATDLLKRGRL